MRFITRGDIVNNLGIDLGSIEMAFAIFQDGKCNESGVYHFWSEAI